jgi:NAD+ synthase
MNFIELNGERSTLSERQKIVLDIFTKMNKANQHKMNPIPVCIIPEKLK